MPNLVRLRFWNQLTRGPRLVVAVWGAETEKELGSPQPVQVCGRPLKICPPGLGMHNVTERQRFMGPNGVS